MVVWFVWRKDLSPKPNPNPNPSPSPSPTPTPTPTPIVCMSSGPTTGMHARKAPVAARVCIVPAEWSPERLCCFLVCVSSGPATGMTCVTAFSPFDKFCLCLLAFFIVFACIFHSVVLHAVARLESQSGHAHIKQAST
jgi:hypothetical protein